jgi:hypothetical protein
LLCLQKLTENECSFGPQSQFGIEYEDEDFINFRAQMLDLPTVVSQHKIESYNNCIQIVFQHFTFSILYSLPERYHNKTHRIEPYIETILVVWVRLDINQFLGVSSGWQNVFRHSQYVFPQKLQLLLKNK